MIILHIYTCIWFTTWELNICLIVYPIVSTRALSYEEENKAKGQTHTSLQVMVRQMQISPEK